MPISLGIDLGTTNSCMAYLEGREPEIIPSPEGSRVIPSLVAINREGKHVFGNVAKRQAVTNSANTIWAVKRLIGRKFDSKAVEAMRKMVGYEINEADNGDAAINFAGKMVSPEEISGLLLTYMKNVAESYLGETIDETVITVPAFFNDAQRQATKNAGEIAGLKVARIINEPTAALIAYGAKLNRDGLYAVYDLGGGTFDISIVEVKSDVYKVLSTIGDTFLGGSDFDFRIIDWVFKQLKPEVAAHVSEDRNTLQRILQAAEKAKIELSFNDQAAISIPYLYHYENGENFHFQQKLGRADFEAMTGDLLDRTLKLVQRSLDEIDLSVDDIERVILVGGQSRMPRVRHKLQELFGKEPSTDLNPEEVVAQGASLQSEILKGKVKDLLLLDVTPLSLGVETKADTFTKLIEKNTTVPIKRSMVFTTINDNQQTVKIHVLQGEREVASQNKSLGYFNLVGIPLAPKGIPQIDVTFEIDANGIVKVSAKDKQTGLTQSMKVQPASGLSPEDIQRIIDEAEQHKAEDRQAVELAKYREQIQEEYETVDFFLKRHRDKLSPRDQEQIEQILRRARKAGEQKETDALHQVLQKLQAARMKVNNILMSEFEK